MSDTAVPSGGLAQPVSAGVLAAFVGFASTFAIVLAGFRSVGASQAEAASGLFAVTLGMGLLTLGLTAVNRMPIAVAWSTPGAALLVATGPVAGGYPAAVGAFLAAAVLVVAAGLVKPFGRAVASIPLPLAGAMLAGVLLDLCLAPVRAVGEMPALALPIVLAWAVMLRLSRLYAVPVAVALTAILVIAATDVPADALAHPLPVIVPVMPTLAFDALTGIALPLFVVTMASQNVPGLAVLSTNGYRPDVSRIFVWTGLGSVATALIGGHTLNLAAITAALCAGSEAHPDPGRRWIAAVANGIALVLLALTAGFAAAFIAASPPLLIQAVAGLALLGSLSGALAGALAREEDRIPAAVTFVTAASGVSFAGIGPAFWGLVAGGGIMLLLRLGRS
jgi:benzoate membrane transport protein